MSKEIAIITGAGSGIGQAISVMLANAGIGIIAVGRREDALLQTQAHNKPFISILSADLTKDTGRNALIHAIPEDKQIKYLIHNAGTLGPLATIASMDEQQWLNTFAINLHAPMAITKALLPKMNHSRILHISSALAHLPKHAMAAYCCSKAALHMLYQVLKIELKDKSIAIGSVMPGIVDTPIIDNFRYSKSDEFQEQSFYQRLYKNKQLVPIETCGKFINWLLLDTSNEQFSENDWDIYDASHHHHWLNNLSLPFPDFEE